MLARSSSTVRDLVEIQQQLTDTQSQLDSETAQRKILANETEKIPVILTFTVERHTKTETGMSQIGEALSTSGAVLGESTASLITFIVTIIPWLILIVPGIWLLRKAWQSLRRNRARVKPPVSTQPEL